MASKRSGAMLLVVAVLAALFGAGLYQLFALRFASGDIYPECSTYRTDPKGAKILFQSLENLPGVEVGRQLKPLGDLTGDGVSVLFLGGSWSLLERVEEDVRPFIESGGRAVFAYRALEPRIGKRKKAGEKIEDGSETNECTSCEQGIHEDWAVELAQCTRDELEGMEPEAKAFPEVGNPGLRAISWNSALWFDELGDEWSVLYRHLGNPVVIERHWEKGSAVLVADSYLFSNEAMVKERHSRLLVRLLGHPQKILFDEMHLGVSSKEGVMMLVNRYRMQGVLAALLVLAGLFVWQRTTSFIPRHGDDAAAQGEIGTGVGSLAGFTNLLMRHIPQKKLMDTMVKEWKATFGRTPSMQSRLEGLEAEVRRSNKNGSKVHPVDLHNRLVKILNERK